MRLSVLTMTLLLPMGLAGCGSDSPTTPAVMYPYDGNWVGRTSEGRDLTVSITNSVVVRFETYVSASSTCYLGLGMKQNVSAVIQNRSFRINLPAGWLSAVTIDGRFDSDRTLSGTISAMDLPANVCGSSSPVVSKAPVTFTAEQ